MSIPFASSPSPSPSPSQTQTFVLAALLVASCTLESPIDEDCFRGKCDDGSDVRSQLDGLDEPIADWLRASPMDRDGILETDYMSAMEQLARFSGCGIDSLKTFVINDDLVEEKPFPRLISTLCSDDENRASSLFVAASFSDPDRPNDVDKRNLEMFAWDETQKRNVFYLLRPVSDSDTQVQVEVEPKSCEQCHRNSNSLDDVGMPMVPIMNELVTPWPHWNSEPDFPSHSFELPQSVVGSPTFAELTAGDRLGAAADLEQLIRGLQTNRVIPERLKTRRNKPATVEAAMSLLRPLYCDEQVNYVTEDHGSGVIPVDVLVSGGIRDMFLNVRATDWPWGWVNSGRMRFANASSSPLTMIPVRGNLDVEYIRRLVAVRAISAEKVLRIQALDWHEPVFSQFRCNLWKDARARLRESPPAINSGTRNSDLLPILYQEIMMLDGELSLIVGDDAGANTKLIIVADAKRDLAEMRNAIATDTVEGASCDANDGFCAADLDSFGALIDTRVRSFENREREEIEFITMKRFCMVRKDFPNRPALPPGTCEPTPRSSTTPGENHDEGADPTPFLERAFASSTKTRLVPDAAPGIESSVEVPSGTHTTFVGSLQVRVQIDHSWRGDLELAIRDPSGVVHRVTEFDPGDSANDVDDTFAVFGLEPTTEGTGTWTLIVTDLALGERGHLLGWSLGINADAPELAVEGTRVAPH